MARVIITFFLLCFSCKLSAQDNVGAGYAISFDGVDDYVELGNIYDDLELPLTISAWIYLDLRGLGTVFTSQDNSQTYNGFHFYVIHSAIIIDYGDGLGIVSPDFRRGKSGLVDSVSGKWVHVAATVRGASDMDLFLNGVNIGGSYIGNSQSPMGSLFPLEGAKIGLRSFIGVTYHFQGIMDELRIWNRSLSQEEIRAQMCTKLTGNESGLIGYWDFDDTKGNILFDKSPNHFDGQIRGNPERVFSGAPIGDESVFLYTNDWHETVLTLHDSLDKVSVERVMGNPKGLHIYKVDKFPSQSAGLNLSTVAAPYFGVFVASDDVDNFFDLNYTHNGSAVCKLFTRSDNSISSWTENASQLTHISERNELIKERWDIVLEIDLGPDEAPCSFSPKTLSPLSDTTGFEFLWQDGSTLSTFQVSDFGTYWVTADDDCTGAMDTLKISNVMADNLAIPNVFTPNGDLLNPFFEVDQRMLGGLLVIYNRWGKEVYQSSNYQNDWDGTDLPTGVYFYSLKGGECITEKRGTLSILR